MFWPFNLLFILRPLSVGYFIDDPYSTTEYKLDFWKKWFFGVLVHLLSNDLY